MKIILGIGFLVLFSIHVTAQTPKNCACCTEKHRQFDFWLGNWEVFDSLGVKQGENLIRLMQDSCALQENWTSGTQTGTSTNYYNATDNTWNQVWVDNVGNSLVLKGSFVSNKMVLKSALIPGKKVKLYYNQIAWEKRTDGTVRQIWTTHDSKGKLLSTVFHGIYKLKIPVQTEPEAKATGIGGVFFKSKDPKTLKAWYETNLGMKMDDYGINFQWREGADSSKYGSTQWSLFKEKTTYFAPSTKEFMINYRVTNLDKLYLQLKEQGVTICDEIERSDYGNFLHILDIEGNKIQLWEPVVEEYNKVVNGGTR